MRKLNNSELKRITIEEFKKTTKNKVVVILDNVRSAQNVGSIFRTSDAFLVEKIYLCGITQKPPSNEIRKTALGATKSVEWEYQTNTNDVVRLLKQKDYKIVGVEQAEKSTSLENFKIEKEFDNKINNYVLKINNLINKFQFNVVIANFYEIYRIFNFYIEKDIKKEILLENLKKIMLMLVPFVPHLANECLQNLNAKSSHKWPEILQKEIANLKIKLVIQVNGKTRDVIEIDRDMDEKKVINLIREKDKIKNFLKGKEIVKHIYIKNKLINLVVK